MVLAGPARGPASIAALMMSSTNALVSAWERSLTDFLGFLLVDVLVDDEDASDAVDDIFRD